MMSCSSPHSSGGGAADASQASACKRRRLVANGAWDHWMTPISHGRPGDDAFSEPNARLRHAQSDDNSRDHPCQMATCAGRTLVLGDAWHLVADMCGSRCAARLAMCSRKFVLFGLMPADPVGHVAEYAAIVFRKMCGELGRFMRSHDYMASQSDLNAQMRAVLVDWLLDVHRAHTTRLETLCVAVSCVDRYFSRVTVPRRKLQLVGAVAMMIAFKVEEVYVRRLFATWYPAHVPCPARYHPDAVSLAHIEYQCDGACSREEVASMECSMLSVLEYRTSVPTVAHVLAYLEVADGCCAAQRMHTRFLTEFALMDYDITKFSPLHVAASVLLLSNRTFERKPEWSVKVANLTRMMPDVFLECQQALLDARFLLAYLAKHEREGWRPFPGRWSFWQVADGGRECAGLFDASIAALAPDVQKLSRLLEEA